MRLNKLATISMVGLLSLVGGNALAANIDAALAVGTNATSTGNFDLSIQKGDAVSITGMSTLTIAGGASPADQTGLISVCTYATTTDYQLEINSLGAGGAAAAGTSAFDADDGAGNLLPYGITWDDGDVLGYNDNGDAPQITDSPNTTDPTCGGGTNTDITVTVSSANFNAAPTATYTDTVEVIITAQ